MKALKNPSFLITNLILSFIGFVILSWWLLFRDERALAGIASFYPFLRTFLQAERETLLHLGLNVVPTFVFAIVALVAFATYYLSLKAPISLKQTLLWSAIFPIIVCLSYPILSTDIFSYVFSDRVATVYHQNTWTVAPQTFKSDPFEPLADWKDQTKVYGLVEQVAYLPAQYIGGNDLLAVIVAYKFTALIFYLATLVAVYKLSEQLFKTNDERSQAIRLLFWNPLFVLEMVASAHNDILMLFFLVLSMSFWKHKKWALAGLALAFSVQVKLIMSVVMVFSTLSLLSQKQWREAGYYVSTFLATNLIAFLVMGISPLGFLMRVLYNNSVYWQSLPALIQNYWPSGKLILTLALIATLLFLAIKQYWQHSNPWLMSALTLLCYVLFFAAAYWNWYAVWVLIWIPFITNKRLKKVGLLLTFTSLLAYPLLWLSLRYGYHNPGWSFIYYGLILGVPAVTGLSLIIKDRPKLLVKHA